MITQAFEQRAATGYTENMNGQLHCDVLETALKCCMAKFSKTKMVFQEDLALWQRRT